MRVSIVGTGYVGLVSGACLADQGHTVACVDADARKVDMINAGCAPIHEDGLPELLRRHVPRELHAQRDLRQAVTESDITFIAVGTPASGGRIDLSQVERAATEIGWALRDKPGYHTVVVKSTVVPGTTTGTVRRHLESASGKQAGADFGLGMNPEFLTEGTAVADFTRPDRLVLGGCDGRTHEVLTQLYSTFDAGVPRLLTNCATAEMIKYASNAVLATLISFSNEIARLCSAIGGVDAREVMRGVHQAGYFTSRDDAATRTAAITAFLQPGCGFGGSCLPKDVTALIGHGDSLGLPMPLLRSVLAINVGQTDEMLRLVARHHPDLRGVPVTVLGLAFKPDTDDVRMSPAFPLIERLRAAGAHLTAYDPVAQPRGQPMLDDVRIADTLPDAIEFAQVILLVTAWPQFRELPALLRGRPALVVDGRRLLEPDAVERYEGIGR
jgi:UDPglucose 6-dehydrogenase